MTLAHQIIDLLLKGNCYHHQSFLLPPVSIKPRTRRGNKWFSPQQPRLKPPLHIWLKTIRDQSRQLDWPQTLKTMDHIPPPFLVRLYRESTLSSVPGALAWQLAKPLDEKIVQLVGSEYSPSRTDLVGAGGEEKWTFLAVKKGTTRISRKYVRPWEKDEPPAEEKTFLIRVDQGPQSQTTYVGILPCADCSGLKTELTLYANGTYYLKETYLATRDGDKSYTSYGKYQRIKSRGRDIVQLNYDKPQEIYNFIAPDDDHLRVLDKELNEIDTPMNMTLDRKK